MAENKKTAGQLAVEAEQARQRLAEVQQQAPGAYQSGYGAQIDALLAKLDSRPGFQYDLQGDALYRQYQQQYQKQGKAAMEDTVGTAAGLTGGYGSSYATTAGSQAYQAYLSKMQDVVPSLYAAAYSRYQDEGSALEKQLEQMKTQESSAYSKWKDQVQQHQAAQNQAMNYWRYLNDAAYQAQQDELAQQNWQQEFDLKAAAASVKSRSGGSRKKQAASSTLTKKIIPAADALKSAKEKKRGK